MKWHFTIWHPDTCECVIGEKYDRDVPPADIVKFHWDGTVSPEERATLTDEQFGRVMEGAKSLKPCALHSGIAKPDFYPNVLGENQTKNRGIKAVVEAHGIGPENWKVQPQEVAWRFDENRNVILKIPAGKVNPSEKALSRTALEKFQGKVTLED